MLVLLLLVVLVVAVVVVVVVVLLLVAVDVLRVFVGIPTGSARAAVGTRGREGFRVGEEES